MNTPTFEQEIVAEYGVVKGWLATHPYISVAIALAVGFLLGKI